MSITYTPSTNFGAKDSLPSNDSNKVIRGSEFTTEFTAIQTAFGLAAPAASPTFTGTVTISSVDINGGTIDGVTIGGSSAGAITGTTGQFNTSLNVDGTVTADGLTVDGSNVALQGSTSSLDINPTTGAPNITIRSGNTFRGYIEGNSSGGMTFGAGPSALTRQTIASNGDISFYEDTGTTPKFFWDASAEALGIGTSSPQKILEVASDDYTVNMRLQSNINDALYFTDFEQVGSSGFSIKTHIFNQPTTTIQLKDGNVGIGTSSPAAQLHLQNGSTEDVSGSTIRMDLSGINPYWEVQARNSGTSATRQLGFYTSATSGDVLTLTQAGSVGIGTSSPGVTLDINRPTSTASYARIGNGGNVQAYIGVAGDNLPVLGSFTNHALRFVVNTSEVARFDTSGNLLVGTTDNTLVGRADSGRVCIDNADGNDCIQLKGSGADHLNIASWIPASAGGFHIGFGDGTGSYTERGVISTNGSTTIYGTTSDYRLKENIQPLSGAIDRLKTLKPSRFNFIETPAQTLDGFIAHEVAEVVPEAVVGEKDGQRSDGAPRYQHLDAAKLVPLLTAALQEALTQIDDLRARVAQLEGA